jgi:hypothetical protein
MEARDSVYLLGAARMLWRVMPKVEREQWRAMRDRVQAGGRMSWTRAPAVCGSLTPDTAVVERCNA